MLPEPAEHRLRNALVVDDEHDVRSAAREYLQDDGFAVLEADSGPHAMDIIAEDCPHIVLMDASMQGLDGYEACALIRNDERTSDLPILIMTESDDAGSVMRAFGSGATDIITKPLNRELLRYRVKCVVSLQQTLERLWEIEDRSGAIVQALPGMLFILRRDGTVIDVTCSDLPTDMFLPPGQAVGRNLCELLPESIAASSISHITRAIDTGEMQVFEYMLPVNRRKSYFEARIKSFGKDTALALVRNITDRKQYELRMETYHRRLEDQVSERTSKLSQTIARLESEIDERKKVTDELALLDNAAKTTMTGITITDLNRIIIYTNPADARMHGYEPEEIIGKNIEIFSPPELSSPMSADDIGALNPWGRETVNVRKDGTRFPVKLVSSAVRDNSGNAIGMVTTCEDISEQKAAERELKRYQDQLEQLVELRTNDLNDTVAKLMSEVDIRKKHEEKIMHLAYHDGLTGLPNRTLFSKRLWSELERARSRGHTIALMYIDLDNFKNINDTLGHTIGDFILCEVGKRLANVVRKDDSVIKTHGVDGSSIVSRLGGDEFILLLTDIDTIRDVERVAERIIDRMSAPINLDCHEIFISPSIGIALYPEHGYDADTLLMNADMAMYNAKNDGKNTYKFYSTSMGEESMRRLMLENDLHRALDRDELSVHYQPQFDMKTGRITCLEALLRWEHRQHGTIMPDTFIPIAEQYGLIIPIGRMVFRKVCEQMTAWRNRNMWPVKIAVNVSGRQFQQNFTSQLHRMLEESCIPADLIELEITESSIMRDPVATIRILKDLKALGLSLAVDDFGTGYSSLNYLRKFPIDSLKIDRSFVREIHVSKDNDAIVRAIIAMAHSMNLKVVAEGVESREQIDFLNTHGCDCVQGYYYCRPQDAAGTENLLVQKLGNCA